jgi:hypothetical protein
LKIVHNPDPGPLRQQAYPSTGDQLDAMWKIIDALLAGGLNLPADALAVRDAVNAVKTKYRKIP